MTAEENSAAEGENKKPRPRKTSQARGANAITLLKNDHKAIAKLLDQFKFDADKKDKQQSLRKIAAAWIRHSDFEENELLPEVIKGGGATPELEQADVERDVAKVLLADLQSSGAGGNHFDAKLRVLAGLVKKLAQDEERPKTGLFALARAAGVDMSALGERLNARRKESTDAEGEGTFPPMPTSLRIPGIRRPEYPEEMEMDRQSNARERDEQGRFMSDDDDDRRSSGRGSSSRSRDYDDDRRGGSRNGGRGMESRGSSRRSDDDDGRGWYGDSEGHSEASRRGWEERQGSSRSRGRSEDYDDDRRSSRSSSRYEDDDRRSSRGGRDDDDDRRGGSRGRGRGGWFGDSEGHSEAAREGWDNPDHGPSGWYGDSRGHSEASRRGWDNPDHGQSGWYGDPEGHSEASRRGWENRGSSRGRSQDNDDDRRSSRSSSRDDDDDRRGGSRGGRGGWSGDPEGHSDASRRGWQNRR
jgi:hypothetical protein